MQKLTPDEFPERLLNISTPPKQLYMKGNLPNMGKYTYICIVGSRKYSPYGKEVCTMIIESLHHYPVVIVSGLAHGIDKIAHETALAHNMITVALPGSGLSESVLYPARHRYLAKQILKHNGALISEFDPNTEGAHWTFPRRNRLMAALSDVIIVIEAQQKSGTKITATYGAEYGKEVIAVPGSIFSKHSQGTHELIADGATPFIDTDRLMELLGFTALPNTPSLFENNTSPEEREILKALAKPRSRDSLFREIDLARSVISESLTELEIQGHIKEIHGLIHRIR